MSRETLVTCDNEPCAYQDGTDGATNWITVKRKKAMNADLCSDGCLAAWVTAQPNQSELAIEREMAGVR
jgi:hypothetical protein